MAGEGLDGDERRLADAGPRETVVHLRGLHSERGRAGLALLWLAATVLSLRFDALLQVSFYLVLGAAIFGLRAAAWLERPLQRRLPRRRGQRRATSPSTVWYSREGLRLRCGRQIVAYRWDDLVSARQFDDGVEVVLPAHRFTLSASGAEGLLAKCALGHEQRLRPPDLSLTARGPAVPAGAEWPGPLTWTDVAQALGIDPLDELTVPTRRTGWSPAAPPEIYLGKRTALVMLGLCVIWPWLLLVALPIWALGARDWASEAVWRAKHPGVWPPVRVQPEPRSEATHLRFARDGLWLHTADGWLPYSGHDLTFVLAEWDGWAIELGGHRFKLSQSGPAHLAGGCLEHLAQHRRARLAGTGPISAAAISVAHSSEAADRGVSPVGQDTGA